MYLHRRALTFILLLCTSPIAPLFGTAALAEVTPRLNSDAIRERFGSYGVEVIEQEETTRAANLFSIEAGESICRTLAVTEFVLPTNEALLKSHQQIIAGGSIGATLRKAGFDINKKLLIKTEVPANAAFVALSKGTVPTGTALYTKVYALFAQSVATDTEQPRAIPYAVIAEAYHPEHFPPVHEEISEAPELREAAQRVLEHLEQFSLKSESASPTAQQN